MKLATKRRILCLTLTFIFAACGLLFAVVLLVCEPADRIPVGTWLIVCVFMAVQMFRLRRLPSASPEDPSVEEHTHDRD